MKTRIQLFIAALVSALGAFAQQQIRDGWWKLELMRKDGIAIPFNFEVTSSNGKKILFIRNGEERIKVDQVEMRSDSIFIQMPVFESGFKGRLLKDGSIEGNWVKGTSSADQVVHFIATPGLKERMVVTKKPAANISGRWAANFVSTDSNERFAVAEFKQTGSKLIGTFLTTTGDYRYLEGEVNADSLLLSTFDGSHAYLFKSKIISADSLANGYYYSGARFKQKWSARKNARARIPEYASAVYLRKGEDRLHFSFPDLDGKIVSINDARFKNKVVVVQIMGSWCPNCMDETKFLSDYYMKNRSRGVEVVSLAYEYSSDFQRSQKSLMKFRDRFNVQYPMLITGAKTNDSLRTEKTLPEITPIKMFPTTIFIGRDGTVKKIDTGFNGPGTGEHYEEFKKKFEEIIESLLKGK